MCHVLIIYTYFIMAARMLKQHRCPPFSSLVPSWVSQVFTVSISSPLLDSIIHTSLQYSFLSVHLYSSSIIYCMFILIPFCTLITHHVILLISSCVIHFTLVSDFLSISLLSDIMSAVTTLFKTYKVTE